MNLRETLEPILREILARGVNDEFQRGYAAGIAWTWECAGLPTTAEFIAVRALATAAYADLK
jgi:hypothetical protein